jgi:hypothetical protein
VEFILKVVDSLFKVFDLCVRTLETGSANIFNSIASKVIKPLISNEVPNFYGTSCVVGG